MARDQNPNLVMLERTVDQLGDLVTEVVFLGGCATGLLITDPAAPPIRVTKDVDVIVEVLTLAEYYELFDRLRKRGFREDNSKGAPLCRWRGEGILLDVMPTDPAILGFGSVWYGHAAETAQTVKLPSGRSIKLVTAPCFLATKLAAFDGRGQGDYLGSHDMEDIAAVIDGHPEIIEAVAHSEERLRNYLAERFADLLADAAFTNAMPAHLPPDASSPAREPLLMDRLARLSRLNA